MEFSKDEIVILVHESALEEMMHREVRLIRQMKRLQEDLDSLGNAIRAKKFAVAAARDRLLKRCV